MDVVDPEKLTGRRRAAADPKTLNHEYGPDQADKSQPGDGRKHVEQREKGGGDKDDRADTSRGQVGRGRPQPRRPSLTRANDAAITRPSGQHQHLQHVLVPRGDLVDQRRRSTRASAARGRRRRARSTRRRAGQPRAFGREGRWQRSRSPTAHHAHHAGRVAAEQRECVVEAPARAIEPSSCSRQSSPRPPARRRAPQRGEQRSPPSPPRRAGAPPTRASSRSGATRASGNASCSRSRAARRRAARARGRAVRRRRSRPPRCRARPSWPTPRAPAMPTWRTASGRSSASASRGDHRRLDRADPAGPPSGPPRTDTRSRSVAAK